jgi:hypothetical protein
MANGIFEARALYAGVNQAVYVNNNDGATVVAVNICNQNHISTKISMAMSTSATSPTASEWIEYEAELLGKGVLERTGLILGPQQYIVVLSSRANVSAVSWGIESGTVTTALTISQNTVAPTWVTSATLSDIFGTETEIILEAN